MNYQRLGMAFCMGLPKEARVVIDGLVGCNPLAAIYNADSDYWWLKEEGRMYDFLLTAEQRAVKAEARNFVNEEITADLLRKLDETGLIMAHHY